MNFTLGLDSNSFPESNWSRWTMFEFEPKFHQFWFERVDPYWWYDFADSYLLSLISVAIIAYLGTVKWLTDYMKDREPYRLREQMFLWNSFVGLVSIIGLQRISSEVLYLVNGPNGFYKSACLRDGLHMSTAWWGILLVLIKPLFIFDTMFLILRKKPIDAMHLIHHTIAIFIAPVLLKIAEPFMRWIGIANLLVHSIDYPLLALRSLKISVPMSRHIMAALEVIQMLFILFVSAYTLFLQGTGTVCLRHPTSVVLTYVIFTGLLLVVLGTFVNPEYWKRGIKKIRSSSIISYSETAAIKKID